MTPPLTVIIPSRRRVDLLRTCLQSVVAHAPTDTEIIVVDDGSRNAIISCSAVRFTGVRVLRWARPRGFCAAANAGIHAASAPLVELLNDDTMVEPGWADAAIDAFADPTVAAVAPLILRGQPGDDPIVDSAGDTYDAGGFAQPRGRGQFAKDVLDCDANIDGVSGCAGFFRRDALSARTSIFPLRFNAYFEDVDLCCRLRRSGFRFVFVPQSRVWHRGGSSHRRSAELLTEQSCNEERVFCRNQTGSIREWTRHCTVLAGKAARRVSEGQLIPWLMGRLQAWTIEGSRRWTSSPVE